MTTKNSSSSTERNVTDSDATLIFTFAKIDSGSALTIKLSKKHHKPYLHIDLEKKTDDEAIEMISRWLDDTNPQRLNVAGSRESTAVGIYGRVNNIMEAVLKSE